jgi:hypothetical protein
MKETVKSYKQIFAFCQAASHYMEASAKDKAEKGESETTKMEYAIQRTFESVQPKTTEYTTKLKDLKLDNALEDERGKVSFTIDIKTGERTYDYSKEGLRKLDEDSEKLFNTEIPVNVYYATSVPEDLPVMYQVLFNGFILDLNTEVVETEKVTIEN